MTHIRIDNEMDNSRRQFACGIGPALPAGDYWVGDGEYSLHYKVDCPGCAQMVSTGSPIGTPISKLSGRPSHKGFDAFKRISESWGYD